MHRPAGQKSKEEAERLTSGQSQEVVNSDPLEFAGISWVFEVFFEFKHHGDIMGIPWVYDL